MKLRDLAKKLRIHPQTLYGVVYKLEAVEGITFTKKRKSYDLSDEEIKLIIDELKKRGYELNYEFLDA